MRALRGLVGRTTPALPATAVATQLGSRAAAPAQQLNCARSVYLRKHEAEADIKNFTVVRRARVRPGVGQ